MSKGSGRRPTTVDRKEFERRYEKTFAPKPVTEQNRRIGKEITAIMAKAIPAIRKSMSDYSVGQVITLEEARGAGIPVDWGVKFGIVGTP